MCHAFLHFVNIFFHLFFCVCPVCILAHEVMRMYWPVGQPAGSGGIAQARICRRACSSQAVLLYSHT